jgi:enoyl-[acyl-carrier-protein] reductase (NADH)
VVLFLASDLSAIMTGSVIAADAGDSRSQDFSMSSMR